MCTPRVHQVNELLIRWMLDAETAKVDEDDDDPDGKEDDEDVQDIDIEVVNVDY